MALLKKASIIWSMDFDSGHARFYRRCAHVAQACRRPADQDNTARNLLLTNFMQIRR
jgi:hypothetical protein